MRTNNVESCYQSGQTGFFIYATCCQTHMSWECSHEQADINRIWKCEKMLENCFEENRCCQETFECRLCVWIQIDSIFEIEFWDMSNCWVRWRCSKIYPYCIVGKFPPFIVIRMVGIPSPFCKYQLKQCIGMHFVAIHSNDPNYFVKKDLEGHSICRL